MSRWLPCVALALVMFPAGLVWQLIDANAGWAALDGHVLFMLSLLVGAIGAALVGALSTMVRSQNGLLVGVLAVEAMLLAAMIVFPGAGDRALLSIAEAAVRTGACLLLLLGRTDHAGSATELVFATRGRWAAAGLIAGVGLAELVSASAYLAMLPACALALSLVTLGIARSGIFDPQTRRVADEFRHENA